MFITAILAFLKSTLSGLISTALKVVKLAADNPVATVAVVVLVGSNWLTHHYTTTSVTQEVTKSLSDAYSEEIHGLTAQITAANADRDALNARISKLEVVSTKLVEESRAEVEKKSKELRGIVASYEERLAKSNKNSVYSLKMSIPNKGLIKEKDVLVDVTLEDGNLVCRQLPKVFMTTVNEMIDTVNGTETSAPIELEMSKEISK